MIRIPPKPTLFPYTTLFRSHKEDTPMKSLKRLRLWFAVAALAITAFSGHAFADDPHNLAIHVSISGDQKLKRLNSSHLDISYSVVCLSSVSATDIQVTNNSG